MDLRTYNSPDGIRSYLGSLEGLHALAMDRRRAFERRERLAWYCLLGRWTLDTWGNLGAMKDPVPAETGVPLSAVADEREVAHMLMARHGTRIAYTQAFDLPPAETPCAECGARWSIADAHDAVADRELVSYLLPSFATLTYADAAAAWIDPAVGAWKPILPMDALRQVRSGEAGHYALTRWRHRRCRSEMMLREERWRTEELLEHAGWGEPDLVPVAERLSAEGAPWFRFNSPAGEIVVGRLHGQVHEVDWSATGRDLAAAFRGAHKQGHPIAHGASFIRPPDLDHAVYFLSLVRVMLAPEPSA